MHKVIKIETSRDVYDVRDAVSGTITVGELISRLEDFNPNTPIVFSNDNGYTFGYISENDVFASSYETEEEEKQREIDEEYDSLREYYISLIKNEGEDGELYIKDKYDDSDFNLSVEKLTYECGKVYITTSNGEVKELQEFDYNLMANFWDVVEDYCLSLDEED